MAYKKSELFEAAKKAAKEKNLHWIEEVIAYIACSKFTFYNLFPVDSDEYNEIKEILEVNRIDIKAKLKRKWYDSDSAPLQIALMKLLGTDEERKKLSNTYIDKSELNINGDSSTFTITRKIISDDSESGE